MRLAGSWSLVRVIFANGDQPIARRIVHEVGKAQLAFGRERLRRIARLQSARSADRRSS